MSKFSKEHLRDPNNRKDLFEYHRDVLREYSGMINDAYQNNYDFAAKFLIWLWQYIRMFKNESGFNPSYLPKMERGQVVLINLGYRIGYELGGAHYGIVLDTDNRKKDGLITTVMMISKKERHTEEGLKPWEYELPVPISMLVLEKARDIMSDIKNNPSVAEALKGLADLYHLSREEQFKQGPLILEKLKADLEAQTAPLIAFSQKMNKGSVIDTRQIVTASKQRIIAPAKRADPLYNVRIPADCMREISRMIARNYIGETLDESPKTE